MDSEKHPVFSSVTFPINPRAVLHILFILRSRNNFSTHEGTLHPSVYRSQNHHLVAFHHSVYSMFKDKRKHPHCFTNKPVNGRHESVAHQGIWIWFKRFTRTIIVFWGRKHLHNRKTICSCALQNPDNGWGRACALCLCVATVRRSAGAGWVFSFHPGRGSVGAAGCTWNRWFSYSSNRAPQHTGSGW